MKRIGGIMAGGLLAFCLAGTARAANVPVNADIATSTFWTSDNVYNLVGQIYVLPGASLTIEAGTVIKSNPADGGSLAVTRGAKIFVNGTKDKPVIFTSTNDTMTSWHVGVNEWGNVTVMGNALISASEFNGQPVVINGVTNTATPTGLNQKQMEGLTPDVPASKVLYGGNDDNDDSGAIHYVSLRYGGKVLGLGNELNGLSLGGIGRETEIHHVDIMNNVDDGIEIWGGTVNLKYVNMWNIGDDGFDVDEGWRGKAQFGLIVQGYGAVAARGSGVSDNGFEIDGAEDSDAQPVSTATIYNFTVIGQPNTGRGGTTWRDNARVQYRNCVFRDLGINLVRFDNIDGDGAQGYGFNGTLSWANTWTTPFSTTSAVNDCGGCAPGSFNHAGTMYQAQTSGNLAEITDSVFFSNVNAAAYTESDLRGVTSGGGSTGTNIVAASSPIVAITRGSAVATPAGNVLPVTSLNPRAANDAATSAAAAPLDGFFTPASFRGGFSPNTNWLEGWTAAHAYGMTDVSGSAQDPVGVIIALNGSNQAVISFPTVGGVTYSVERSANGAGWSPFTTVAGDGTTKSVTDTSPVASAVVYQVVAL